MIKIINNRLIICTSVVFHLLINIPGLAGLIGYGDDTSAFDLPFRTLASALAANGDVPLWYPQHGDGFPQLSLEFVTLTWNPMAALLGIVRPYDSLSLAAEIAIWRLIGFTGAYRFARLWGTVPLGAIAIASTYVGSGTMARASLAFATLIGQMLAPWMLVAASLAILATSRARVFQAGAVLGLAASAMVWAGYAGTWISAPVLSGPLLISLALTKPRGLWRLLGATWVALPIALLISSPVISETLSGTLTIEAATSRAREVLMLVGHVRSLDLIGLLLVNPSYAMADGSETLQPLYGGILPPLILLTTLRFVPRLRFVIVIVLLLVFSLLFSNTINWSLYTHPIFGKYALGDGIYNFDSYYVVIFFIALLFSNIFFKTYIDILLIDKIFLYNCLWILCVSTDNIFANLLRHYVIPFSLVRHNMLFFWLVSLLFSIVAWRQFEKIIHNLPESFVISFFKEEVFLENQDVEFTFDSDSSRLLINQYLPRLVWVSACTIILAILASITNHEGFRIANFTMVGVTQLVWQFTVFLVVIIIVGYALYRNYKYKHDNTHLLFYISIFCISIYSLILIFLGLYIRKNGYVIERILIKDYVRLGIDIIHYLVMIICFILCLIFSKNKFLARLFLTFIMILDISLATSRYYFDNERLILPQSGWPFTLPHFKQGNAEDLFKPDQNDGSLKGDFWQPFTGSFRPPPNVSRLRASWGDIYETWVVFPTYWYSDGDGLRVVVPTDALETGKYKRAKPRTPTWGVNTATTGGRSNTTGTLDDSALAPYDIDNLSRHDACTGQNALDDTQPSGQVRRLLATRVEVSLTSDCGRLIAFTDSWAPGWSATIDGVPTPVLRVNNAIRGVMVPSGEHALQWRYRPRFLAPLLALLAAGLAISGILIAAPWWSRRFPMPRRLDRLFSFGPLPPDEIRFPMLAPLAPNTPVPAVAPGSTGAPARDWHRLPAMWRHGLPIALPLTGLAILVLASVTAYDPRIDGPTQGFRLFLFRSVLAGLWAWIVIAGRTGFRSPVGPSLMLLVLLPPLALQVARHTYPFQAGTPLATIATDFRSPSWQSTWEVTHRGNAPGDPGSNGTILRNDGPNAMAITFATTPIPKDLWPWWRRPLGKIGPGPLDVTWTASLDRSGPYYTVATLGRLTIQALKNGYLVTAPVPGGDVRGDFVEVPDTGQPGPVRWLLRIEPDAGASLSLDDRPAWKGGHPGVIERITLGDASNDPEHRGTMSITDASIVQRVALTAQ